MKIHYSFPTLENPFWQTVVDGMTASARAAGAEVVLLSAEDDEERQAEHLFALVHAAPDVVLVSPCGMSLTRPALARLTAAKIPIVAVDQNLGSEVVASVISGNTAGGLALGAFVAERVPAGSKLLHLEAQVDLQSVMIRRQSFLSRAQRSGDEAFEVIKRNAGGSRRRARAQVESCLAEGHRFDAVFAENDVMALGALDALSAVVDLRDGRGWPVIVGFDAIAEAVDAIRSGRMAATVMQRPLAMGAAAAELAMSIDSEASYESLRTVLTELITIDNVEEHFGAAAAAVQSEPAVPADAS